KSSAHETPQPIRDQSESSQISQSQGFFSKLLDAELPHEAQNILHTRHVLGRDRACPRCPIDENTVDKGWVVLQAFHLGADRSDFCHREIDKRRFESREITAAEGLQDIDFRLAVECGEN